MYSFLKLNNMKIQKKGTLDFNGILWKVEIFCFGQFLTGLHNEVPGLDILLPWTTIEGDDAIEATPNDVMFHYRVLLRIRLKW